MKEQLISFETAKLAKEKGFDEPCREYYNKDEEVESFRYFAGDGSGWDKNSTIVANDNYKDFPILAAPTQSFLQKWLREEHNIDIESRVQIGSNAKRYFYYINCTSSSKSYTTYEEALEQGLLEGLKLVI
jgi:hypothetical protein